VIRGQVSSERAAQVKLWIGGPSGDLHEISATIDTGFTDFLALPSDVIASLKLPYDATFPAILGDGSTSHLDFHRVTVVWGGRQLRIQALATAADALIGMALLDGQRLTLDVTAGGAVTIEPLQ